MSDTSQGPGWWYASDGKWYPPVPPPPEAPAPGGEPGSESAPSWSPPDASGVTPPSPFGLGPSAQQQSPPAAPDAADVPPPKSRRTAMVLVALAVVLAIVVIGGIIAATQSSSDKKDSAASSSTATSTASTSTTTGGQTAAAFKTFHDTTNGFSIGTPPSWQQVNLSDPKAQASIDQLIAQNPQLAHALGDAATLAGSGIKFLAVDPTGGSTVNIAVHSAPGAPADPSTSDLESIVPDLTKGLEATGAKVTSHEIVTVNGRKAIKVLFDEPLTNGGTEINVHGTAYVFVAKDTIYTVTIVGTTDVVDQVISTFTIG